MGCGDRHSGSTPATYAASNGQETLASGVTHFAIQTGANEGVDLIDITVPNSSVVVRVGGRDVAVASGSVTAVARAPEDWLSSDGDILAAVNGGYFGRTVDDRKEVVGLLVTGGRVRHAAPPIVGTGSAGLAPATYVRSAFGIMPDGEPKITWAATVPGAPRTLLSFPGPIITRTHQGVPWHPVIAIGCGPTLIHDGATAITDRSERLANPEPCPRTFVAYSRPGPGQHLIIGVASSMTYDEVAQFLTGYFRDHGHTPVWDAMCLDGGASTQMSYRLNGNVVTPRATGVTVADSLLVVARRSR